MPDFKSFAEYVSFLEKKINSALKNEVAEAARDEMQVQIQEQVYDVYEPTTYIRRGYNDGLIDPHNIEIQAVGDDSISIENIAYDGNRNVPYIVESGQGYFAGAPDVLTKGRKFTEATRESLRSGKFKLALAKGLKRQGIDTQ